MLAIADVAVTVKDAKAAAKWWQEALGFDTHTIGPEGGHALMIAPAGERFVLHLCEGFDPDPPGNTGIAFMTDDIDAVVGRMERYGVQFSEPLQRQSWGASAKFSDPDGNIFWLLGAPTAFIQSEVNRRAAGAGPARSVRSPRRGTRTKVRAKARRLS